jgi:hypothetical protein
MDWGKYLESLTTLSSRVRMARAKKISKYLAESKPDSIPEHLPEYKKLQRIRGQILKLLEEADSLASIIRNKSGAA